jgi:hypothetical protein
MEVIPILRAGSASGKAYVFCSLEINESVILVTGHYSRILSININSPHD